MKNAQGSWSGMRKYLEQEMLAESLKGRVQYICSTGPCMDDFKFFELRIDKKVVKRFSWETVQKYFIDSGISSGTHIHPMTRNEFWDGFFKTLDSYPVGNRDEYTDDEFCASLARYRNQSIEKSIDSADPIERMFAIFDRRTGKRTLLRIKERMADEPLWLRDIIKLRLDAEKIS